MLLLFPQLSPWVSPPIAFPPAPLAAGFAYKGDTWGVEEAQTTINTNYVGTGGCGVAVPWGFWLAGAAQVCTHRHAALDSPELHPAAARPPLLRSFGVRGAQRAGARWRPCRQRVQLCVALRGWADWKVLLHPVHQANFAAGLLAPNPCLLSALGWPCGMPCPAAGCSTAS